MLTLVLSHALAVHLVITIHTRVSQGKSNAPLATMVIILVEEQPNALHVMQAGTAIRHSILTNIARAYVIMGNTRLRARVLVLSVVVAATRRRI